MKSTFLSLLLLCILCGELQAQDDLAIYVTKNNKCQQEKKKTDLELKNLKGRVKMIIDSTEGYGLPDTTWYNRDGQEVFYKGYSPWTGHIFGTNRYDHNGNKLSSIYFHSENDYTENGWVNSEFYDKTDYKYSETGQRSEELEVVHQKNAGNYDTSYRKYDTNGQLIWEKRHSESLKHYTYNSNGKCIRMCENYEDSANRIYTDCTYDSECRLIQALALYKGDTVLFSTYKYNSMDSPIAIYSFYRHTSFYKATEHLICSSKYDKAGLLVSQKCENYGADNGWHHVLTNVAYQYDSMRKMTVTKITYAWGIQEETHTYKYDREGNWIDDVGHMTNNFIYHHWRKIYYY